MVITGGPSVDQNAVNQEQSNQKQGEKYAAQAQAQALANLQSYLKTNPSPVSGVGQAGAITPPPGAAAPGAVSTGTPTPSPAAAQGGGPTATPGMTGPPQQAGMPQQAPRQAGGFANMSPQAKQQIIAMLQQQGGH